MRTAKGTQRRSKTPEVRVRAAAEGESPATAQAVASPGDRRLLAALLRELASSAALAAAGRPAPENRPGGGASGASGRGG